MTCWVLPVEVGWDGVGSRINCGPRPIYINRKSTVHRVRNQSGPRTGPGRSCAPRLSSPFVTVIRINNGMETALLGPESAQLPSPQRTSSHRDLRSCGGNYSFRSILPGLSLCRPREIPSLFATWFTIGMGITLIVPFSSDL